MLFLAGSSIVPGEMRWSSAVLRMNALCMLCLYQDHRIRESSGHHNLDNDDSMEMT